MGDRGWGGDDPAKSLSANLPQNALNADGWSGNGSWKLCSAAGICIRMLKGKSAVRMMVPSLKPKRHHGGPQFIRLRSSGKASMVRAEGLEPSRALRPNGFSYPSTAFAAPAVLAG